MGEVYHLRKRLILSLASIGLLAAVSGFNAGAVSSATPVSVQPVAVVEKAENKPKTVQESVEEYFADIPVMVRVAYCESRFRHIDNRTGRILRGEVNSYDVGVMQINEWYHLETSRKLGYDVHTLEGNMAYARYLYEREGARPWLSSSPCWAKAEIAMAR